MGKILIDSSVVDQVLEALVKARGALAYVALGNAIENPNLARSTCSHGIYAIDKVESTLREVLTEQGPRATRKATRDEKIVNPGVYEVPVTTPQQAKRVELTDEFILSLHYRCDTPIMFARSIMAAYEAKRNNL